MLDRIEHRENPCITVPSTQLTVYAGHSVGGRLVSDDFAGSPVDIIQPELGYFARPHTETNQHGQNGDVPAAAPRGVVARREKASNLVGSQPLRQPDQS